MPRRTCTVLAGECVLWHASETERFKLGGRPILSADLNVCFEECRYDPDLPPSACPAAAVASRPRCSPHPASQSGCCRSQSTLQQKTKPTTTHRHHRFVNFFSYRRSLSEACLGKYSCFFLMHITGSARKGRRCVLPYRIAPPRSLLGRCPPGSRQRYPSQIR